MSQAAQGVRAGVVVSLFVVTLFACERDPRAEGDSGPPAGPPAPRTLVLDRILAGTGQGRLTFGSISHIAVERLGGVVIEDPVGRAVVRVRADGAFRDSLGRRGDGPGEYRNPYGLAVLADGLIAVRDTEPPAILLFDSLGSFVREWSLLDRVPTAAGLWVDVVGGYEPVLRLKVPFAESAGPYGTPALGFVALAPSGEVVDSLPPPDLPSRDEEVSGPFQPRTHLAWHPEGFAVVGFSDRYRIDLLRSEGTVRIERTAAPVPVSSDEREADATILAIQRARGARGLNERPAIPDQKPAYRRILIAQTGEIWVVRHAPGVRWGSRTIGEFELPLVREPLRVDVYDSHGRHLVSVEADAGIEPHEVRGDTVWTVVTGALEEEYLARYLVR